MKSFPPATHNFFEVSLTQSGDGDPAGESEALAIVFAFKYVFLQ